MPLYYNTAPPTPGSKNSITRTATSYGIRDFLLHKNIQNPIKYPYLSTSINGAPKGGEPFLDTMVGTGVIIQHNPIKVDGIPRYNSAIIMNQYKNTDSTAPDFFDIGNVTQVSLFPNSTPPSGINNYKQEDITLYGLLAKSNEKNYRKISTLKNQYVDSANQIDMADFISLQPVQTAQQLGSYLDEYGGLNLGGGAGVNAVDVIGSVLNGGIGLSSGGISTNFDIRASLAGRVLTATGLLNDTKLGVIAGQQLALSLANNAGFNTQQLLLGTLNAQDNVLSLVKNGTLVGFRPDYTITTSSSGVLNYAEKILGFNVPKSFLTESASIFASENGGIGNIQRANAMLLNTGKGQVTALIANINANLNGTSPNGYDSPDAGFSFFRSGYAPGYFDNKGKKAINPKGYAFMDKDGFIYNFFSTGNRSCIPEISWNREKMVHDAGFTSIDGNDGTYTVDDGRPFATKFAWTSDKGDAINSIPTSSTSLANSSATIYIGDKKSLLTKTQQLFSSVGMKSIVSVKGDMKTTTKTQIQSSVSPNGFISKGSGVLSGSKFNGDGTLKIGSGDTPDNTFCRAWTPFNRYDKVSRLIRNRGLNQTESGGNIIPEGGLNGGWRQNTHGSVLDSNGFVKIAPYKTDNLTRHASAPKKYMFSIENLAWVGTPAVNLLPSEQGPGDLLTGKFGRIMWFPPYDITFNETSSVSLESTNFIGRGEPIYTYNNTERSGTLSFKIIVDHPSIMNSFAGDSKVTDEYIDSFFAGCVDLDDKWAKKLTGLEINEIEQSIKQDVTKVTVQSVKMPSDFKIYFENDVTNITQVLTDNYETKTDINSGVGTYQGEPQVCNGQTLVGRTFVDNQSFGLNIKTVSIPEGVINGNWAGWVNPTYQAALTSFLTVTCPTCKVKITGSASAQKLCNEANNLLAKNRAKSTYDWFLANIVNNDKTKLVLDNTNSIPVASNPNYTNTTSSASQSVKEDRFVNIHFYDVPEATETPKDIEASKPKTKNRTLTTDIKKRFYTEADFFEKLTDEDSFVFDKIRKKIKFFHPAFHSTTPEGLNSRLTFLLQCTRQGPTIKGTETRNLAFGPPPVCILRIGDFYNTKIMMDNVSFDFEPLVWDLNPEGIGVQPMIANVTISFKFIGGSSLYGPINKLQNALSFNYFANTQVYDPRADYISAGNNTTSSPVTSGSSKNSLTSYKLSKGLDSTSVPMGEVSTTSVKGHHSTKTSGTQVAGNNSNNNK